MTNKERDHKVKQLRLLQIDYMIRSGTYPNVPEMRERFEVSRSTIMRDLEFLQARYKAPLKYDIKRKGYYYKSIIFKRIFLNDCSNGVFLYCSNSGTIVVIVKSSPSDNIILCIKKVGSL